MDFADRLAVAIRKRGNCVLVGIDPRPESLPEGWLSGYPSSRAGVASALQDFGNQVLDVVAPLVPAVKFQAAFYEAYGPEGMAALHASVAHARELGLLVILDGKRNDIGSTAQAYASAYLGTVRIGDREVESWSADALTINPYLGSDGIAPFTEVATRRGKGLFVLVRTSNPSAREFQDLVADGRPIYRHVADRLREWAAPHHHGESGYSALGAVVGATYPHELEELRAALPGIIFLVPGYGSQGGTARDVAPAFDADGLGALVNNSRGLVFAYERPEYRQRFGSDWQRAVEQATRDMIDDLAAHTPAGRLRSVMGD